LEDPVSTLVMFTIHVLSMQSASTPTMELTAVVLKDIKAMDLLDVHQVWCLICELYSYLYEAMSFAFLRNIVLSFTLNEKDQI
jgi:hypothetical protein